MPNNEDKSSRCYHCEHLQVWGNAIEGSRYTCFKRYPKPSQFGKYGRDTAKGVPMIKLCNQYKDGRHYSRKNFV